MVLTDNRTPAQDIITKMWCNYRRYINFAAQHADIYLEGV